MPLPYELVNAAVRGFSEGHNPYKAGLSTRKHSSIARLLLDAARLSIEAQAGYIPKSTQKPIPPAIENSDYPTCGLKAQQQLKLMLNGEYKPLLQQWLELLTNYQQRVPDELLPILLDYGGKTTDVQPSLRHALGERGLWLAKQDDTKSSWGWLLKTAGHPRDYDSHYDAWRDYLVELRHQDAGRARELVQEYWPSLDGMMQIILLKAFEINLGSDDVEFLEMVLQDESTRLSAARLLMQIPGTAFRQELEEKVQRLLVLAQMGHRKQWVVDFSWSSAFDGHPAQLSRTEASKLYTVGNSLFNPNDLVMIMPLQYWYETYGVDAHALAEAARNSTNPSMFYRIWTNLAMESHDSEFLFAMVLNLPRYGQSVARALSADQKELAALHWLNKNPRFSPEHGVIPLLNAHTEVWGETLSKRFLEILALSFLEISRPLLEAKIRKILGDYTIYFPLSLRDEFARVIQLNERGDFSESEQEQANAILHLLSFRAEMQAALENKQD
jgi:hypothetical protein